MSSSFATLLAITQCSNLKRRAAVLPLAALANHKYCYMMILLHHLRVFRILIIVIVIVARIGHQLLDVMAVLVSCLAKGIVIRARTGSII